MDIPWYIPVVLLTAFSINLFYMKIRWFLSYYIKKTSKIHYELISNNWYSEHQQSNYHNWHYLLFMLLFLVHHFDLCLFVSTQEEAYKSNNGNTISLQLHVYPPRSPEKTRYLYKVYHHNLIYNIGNPDHKPGNNDVRLKPYFHCL